MSATVQYITDISSTSGQTTYTFTDVPLGTPGADRKVVLCVETRKTGTGLCEIVAASIGGVAATPVFQQASSPSGTVNYAGIVSADVPSGSTGDISITFSVPVLRVGGQVYAVTGSPHQADASLLDHPSVSLDVPADGFAIGCLSVASNQSFDWGGIDQDHIDLVGGSLRVASASRSYETASDGQALSITRTSGTWSSPVGVFAVWGPDEEPEPIAVALTANTGELSLSGQLAAARSDAAVSAETGSFAMAGQAAIFITPATDSLASDTGSLSIAGQPALLQVSSSLVAGGGLFASAGQDAAFITPATDTLAGDTGTLAIGGQTGGLIAGAKIAADQTAFGLAGSDAMFVVPSSDSLAADCGAFTIAGQAAAFPASPEVGTRYLFLRYGTDSILALRY